MDLLDMIPWQYIRMHGTLQTYGTIMSRIYLVTDVSGVLKSITVPIRTSLQTETTGTKSLLGMFIKRVEIRIAKYRQRELDRCRSYAA